MELTHIATREGRLSSFLRNELSLSASLMNRLKWQNKLLVNGVPRFADYEISVGDVITADLDEPAPDYPAEDTPITVLYEDEHILAVDKPAGILIHPSNSRNTGTLANRVLGYYERTGQNSAFHPVTRLDRDTFGIVLLAKNAFIHEKLNALHSAGKLEKTYEALVYGRMSPTQGEICAPIARKGYPSLLREIRPDGKPSLTRYQVLEQGDVCSLVSLQPITGRTHQLRVHLSYLGFPILGDPQYATQKSAQFSAEAGYHTQMLCAKRLRFPHPVTGEPLELTSRNELSLPK